MSICFFPRMQAGKVSDEIQRTCRGNSSFLPRKSVADALGKINDVVGKLVEDVNKITEDVGNTSFSFKDTKISGKKQESEG